MIVAASPRGSAFHAQTSGQLAVSEGGCLGLGSCDEVSPIAWPPNTAIDHDDSGVTIGFHGTTYSLGDEVELGGGYTAVDIPDSRLPDIPEECYEEEIFIANND